MKLKRLLIPFLLLLILLVSCKKQETDITVFSNGKTDYSIIIDKNASTSVSSFASDLSKDFSASCEIYDDESKKFDREIIIGHTNRAITAEYILELDTVTTDYGFGYLIAEKDGNIIIISNNDAGYAYAMDYIKANYQDGNLLKIPTNCHVMIRVSWDDYYKSDYYADVLAKEEEQKQLEEERELLENELNRYDKEMENFMTIDEAIEQYRKLAANFNSEDFGTYDKATYTSVNKYKAPPIYPGERHPRVMFTEKSLETIRENLSAEENAPAYAAYMSSLYAPTDGIMKDSPTVAEYRYDGSVINSAKARALRYALTGEKLYGYQAIYCLKNIILSLNIPSTVSNAYRGYGNILFTAAMIYDWCYDLLTDLDKSQIISGCIELVAPHMEIVKYGGAQNRAPITEGAMYGHGAEAQLLREFLAFSIAVYDEAPEIYELVAGRLFSEYRDAQNFLYSSGTHWEGDNYGNYRIFFSLYSNFLINRMTDGEHELLSDDMHEAVITLMHNMRPDNQTLRIGDSWTEKSSSYNLSNHWYTAFIAGAYYKDSYLKTFAYDGLSKFTQFTGDGDNGVSWLMVLTMNDPSVSHDDHSNLEITRTTKFPFTNLYARSAWEDVNAFMVWMTMPETHGVSHAHMECGSFQIFYKGILASDSGRYEGWGSYHHMGYTMQTVSSNSILVYNPAFADYKDDYRTNLVYSGGQSIRNGRSALPETLEALLKHPAYNQVTSLGVANVERDGKYLYSYMGGDMTKAYDEETVDEVTRYMFAVATDDVDRPLVFVTFDRITSDDASFRKSALIHVQQEPTVTNDGFAIVTNTKNGNNGKMIVQTVGDATEYTLIGGEGKEFWLCDHLGNAPVNTAGNVAEYGWGRIEISPAEADLTNYMLTVMYVTDATNKSAPIKAVDLSSENVAGTMLLGKAIFFPKNEKLFTSEITVTVNEKADCYVTGISAGDWTVYNGDSIVKTVTVEEGTNLLTFTANTGTYTIKPAN